MTPQKHTDSAFTLIELSIVLVIIGLVVGGILVGRDLIAASAIQSQITQIQTIRTGVNTFKGKYGYLPGDIPNPDASNFGFVARGAYAGTGDGNGLLQGVSAYDGSAPSGIYTNSGENALFWRDLTEAGLYTGSFSSITASTTLSALSNCWDTFVNLPEAKLRAPSYLYTYSFKGENYLGHGGGPSCRIITSHIDYPNFISVKEAYSIDTKIDDGNPQMGSVLTFREESLGNRWSYGNSNSITPWISSIPVSTGNCYDNNNVPGVMPTYSLSNGNYTNCFLSGFNKFQTIIISQYCHPNNWVNKALVIA